MTGTPVADLAVVIVNFNTGDWLARCLRSLEDARGSLAVDVLVVDNDSRDASAEAVESAGARLVRNPTNRYLSPAWNQGAAATDAPYILFLNEHVQPITWVGMALIVGGILLIAQGSPQG